MQKEYRLNNSQTGHRFFADDLVEDPIRNNTFTYFLRAVMIRRRLDEGCLQTLSLLSQVNLEPLKKYAYVWKKYTIKLIN